mmetsp:Transcript_121088/g.328609  ORF Transcript_121088/g.328609 Transcript_121088/m.328609 type:complete len:233 (+) Transcript_121088:494-1192(+)
MGGSAASGEWGGTRAGRGIDVQGHEQQERGRRPIQGARCGDHHVRDVWPRGLLHGEDAEDGKAPHVAAERGGGRFQHPRAHVHVYVVARQHDQLGHERPGQQADRHHHGQPHEGVRSADVGRRRRDVPGGPHSGRRAAIRRQRDERHVCRGLACLERHVVGAGIWHIPECNLRPRHHRHLRCHVLVPGSALCGYSGHGFEPRGPADHLADSGFARQEGGRERRGDAGGAPEG